MKKILLLLSCAFLATSLLAQNKAVIDKVIATVGGETILLSELQEQVSYTKQQQGGALPADFDCTVLQSLIVQRLLVNQAKLDSVEVKDDEVENQLDARVERLLLYFNQDSKAIEEYYGQGIEQIKEQMRSEMKSQMLAERMQATITAKATITPAEVQKFFKAIPKDSLPFFNAEVEVREIVYKPKVNSTEKAAALEKIQELRQRIINDEADFAELARKYSDDPGSGSAGGDLGWQKRGTFVQEFEAAVYKLERNEISPVVETEFGFHIIQMLERRGNLVHSRHILIKPRITDEDLRLAVAKLDSVRQIMQTDSIPFSFGVKTFGDENVPSYNNDGRVTNPRTGNTFFEVADLDTDIFFAIDTLDIGEISAPVGFKGPDGTQYYRLIQLQSRSRPHRADLKLDYSKIQAAALEEKKAGSTEKWMLDKLQATYLSVDPLFSHCPNIIELVKQSASPGDRP